MNLKRTVKSFCALVYKNRAKIETVAGMVCVAIGTGIVISKAKKAAEISYEIEERLDDIHEKDATRSWEDKKDRSKARVEVLRYAAVNYTKTYWLGLSFVLGGEVLQGLGYATVSQQLTTATALAASYAATLNAVKERVVEDQGEEKWQEYLFGPQIKTVDVMADGTVVETTKTIPDENAKLGLPPHCFLFDEYNCPNSWEKDPLMNRDFLENHQRWLNEKLWAEGFLWENDIRRDLKAPLVKSGWTSGIFAEKIDPVTGDRVRNYLSLGLDAQNLAAQRFRDGVEPSIMIQMNLEDNITDQLKIGLI